ncbi:MAG: hypothetical protein ACJA2S_005140 [Cyclobacteriaceae bacterium]|jgi:hypothetical protein
MKIHKALTLSKVTNPPIQQSVINMQQGSGKATFLGEATLRAKTISKLIFYLADLPETNEPLSDSRKTLCLFIFCVCPAWACLLIVR